MEKLALRISEAADALGISRSKTYGLIAAGMLPVIRVGKTVRIPAEGLRAWIRQQTRDVGGTRTQANEKGLRQAVRE